MRLIKTCLSLLILLAVTAPAWADPASATVAMAVANADRSDADRERDITSKPARILTFFGVEPGMEVLDLFSGGGYYSEILSHAVGPEGRVVAHNTKAYLNYVADEIAARYRGERLPNVERLTTETDNLSLSSNRFDLILIVLGYHDIYYSADYWPAINRDRFFEQIYRALKPGGTLAIVDHAAPDGTGTAAVQALHRIDEHFARLDIESAGFTFEASSDILRNPDDTRTLGVFDKNIRRNTDRFVYRFAKPE
jgi:predicted methyltransferase